MYELSNKVRLINVSEYPITSYEGFLGFVSGIISQDHDLEQMYLDSFLKLSNLEGQDITEAILTLDEIGKKYDVDFIVSVSLDEVDMSDEIKKYIVISL